MLPLHVVSVTLKLNTEVTLPFFHQPLLRAFLYDQLKDHLHEHDGFFGLTFDAPETGRSYYPAGSHYRFVLFVSGKALGFMDDLIKRLQSLPVTTKRTRESQGLFPHQVYLHSLTDVFSGEAITEVHQLSAYGHTQLDDECAYWQSQTDVSLQLVSPMRLKRTRQDCDTHKLKNEARFCRSATHLSETLFWQRLHDAFAKLALDNGVTAPAREDACHLPYIDMEQSHLFWADNQYGPKAKPVGGLLGELKLQHLNLMPSEKIRMLVLGQYTGLGQQRSSGLGHYRLVHNTTSYLPFYSAAEPLLLQALETENLLQAWQTICENQKDKDAEFFSDIENDLDSVQWRFDDLKEKILTGQYQPAALQGHVISKSDGGLRALAIPSFWERVLQRATTQVMAPALEQYYDPDSYGYRFGRSRLNAKEEIEKAYQDGFHWVFEADINDFFDSVCWHILEQKLNALYRFDPIVHLLMDWIKAPVDYKGHPVARERGLPQGCPVSPMLANIMLDEFDADLASRGFRLVRYADDFVVLCKSREQAAIAGDTVRNELAELGLHLNENKSGVVSFQQGFRYLGYLFVDGLTLESKNAKDVTGTPNAPSGWLAQIWQKKPHLLERHKDKLPQSPALKTMGDIPDSGMTLVVAGSHSVLSNKHQQLQIMQNEEVNKTIPWSMLSAVLLIGSHHISTPALRTALKNNVDIHFADAMGHYQGSTTTNQARLGTELWRLQMAQFNESDNCLGLAKAIVRARLQQQQETLRQRLKKDLYGSIKAQFDELKDRINSCQSLAQLNGYEGSAARLYFAQIKSLVPEWVGFSHRQRRPPPDVFNALLSLGYTLLYGLQHSLLHTAGLLPTLGFYHKPRGTHASLASDLMEPFRHLVERQALNSIVKISPKDIGTRDNKTCQLPAEVRKQYLAELWQKLETHSTSKKEKGSHLWHMQNQTENLVDVLRHGSVFVPFGVK